MTLLKNPTTAPRPSRAQRRSTLEIDGLHVTVPDGTSVMRAAALAGVDVPKLCATDQPRGVRLLPAVPGRDRGPQRYSGLVHHAGRPTA